MSTPHPQCRQAEHCELFYPDIPDRPPPLFPYNNTAPIYIEQKNSEWNGFMLTATIASIGCVFLVTVVAYYVYFRWYSNTLRQAERFRRQRRIGNSQARRFPLRSAAEDYFFGSTRDGLGSSMVDALPVFVYKPESFEDGLRCAVCLCEFQENEKARKLPSCNHSFHVDCIDMWFYSHSTCPLCRASVEAQSDETVESGPTQIEVSVGEEADGKVIMNSTSGSAAAEQNNERENNGDERKETEEGGGPQVAIDIPNREK